MAGKALAPQLIQLEQDKARAEQAQQTQQAQQAQQAQQTQQAQQAQQAQQEAARLEQRNEEMRATMRRRVRSTLQPQDTLFSVLGQAQSRATLG